MFLFRFNNPILKETKNIREDVFVLFFFQKLWLNYFFKQFIFWNLKMEIHRVLWIDPTPCSNSFVSANNRFHASFQFESAKECKWNSIIDLEGVISATKSPFFKVSHFNLNVAQICVQLLTLLVENSRVLELHALFFIKIPYTEEINHTIVRNIRK